MWEQQSHFLTQNIFLAERKHIKKQKALCYIFSVKGGFRIDKNKVIFRFAFMACGNVVFKPFYIGDFDVILWKQ